MLNVDHVLAALQIFRKAIPYAATNSLIAFLYIARKPGSHVMDVQRACGMSGTAPAKALQVLYGISRGKPGKDLVESRVDWTDQRHRKLYLTPKGERLYTSIKAVLNDGEALETADSRP